ncbi:MAG: EF-Tu/IF-2/RF-3 family GTPase, partial [Eubacteriales bacterium]|nr:EF-Tu/IF-2/RF-3 family GTPase [Eubacteriales bacterium]
VIDGELTPIFFGSAITNFGVEPFLKQFIKMSPSPGPRMSANGYVDPIADKFSGFVFKIQANMNPLHRDRIAFMRIVSGRFEKGMSVFHSGTGKEIRLSQPQQFMAQDRIITEEAFPGDIVGLFDTGILKIGDTLTADKEIKYEGIPLFPSEHFAKIYAPDSMKRKQFLKGINQLSEEGAIQVYKQVDIGVEELVIGAVGALQFEVLEYRLKGEYGVDIRLQKLPYRFARWLAGETVDLNKLNLTSSTLKARDMCGRYVLLFESEWSIKWAKDKNKGLELTDIAPTDI